MVVRPRSPFEAGAAVGVSGLTIDGTRNPRRPGTRPQGRGGVARRGPRAPVIGGPSLPNASARARLRLDCGSVCVCRGGGTPRGARIRPRSPRARVCERASRAQVEAILDSDGKVFVVKLWRMLLFEVLRADSGLVLA